MEQHRYYYGLGKRKCSIARVRLYLEEGSIVINGKPMEEHFPGLTQRAVVIKPLQITDSLNRFAVTAKINGGGIVGQAGALAHGIARALAQIDDSTKSSLRQAGLLTRDPRIKERKKYGLKRARKAPQYTKR